MRRTHAGWHRRVGPVLLLVASVCLAFGVGELFVRATWSRQKYTKPAPPPPELRGLPKLKGIFTLGRPNMRGVFGGKLFETNSEGFRDREYTQRKSKDVFRIAVVGDSFTMGSGVNAEETYAALVERALNEPGNDRTYEVLNLGLAGLNLRWIVRARLEKIGLKFDPDMIVYGFTLNDIEGSHYRRSPTLRPMRELSTNASHLLGLLRVRWDYFQELIAPRPGSYVYELDENYFRNPEAWSEFIDGLDRLAANGERLGACVTVLIHTRLYALSFLHPFRRHYEAVADAARERGLFVIESLPAFAGRSAPSLWVSAVDPHPNAQGHQILADTLLEGLDALPEHCWQRAASQRVEGSQ